MFLERATPHPWSWICIGTALTTPTTFSFKRDPIPTYVIILCAWYTIWVLIPIKSIVSGIHNTLRPLLTSQTHLLKGAHLVIEKKTFYTYSVGCHPSLYIDSDPPVSIELFKKAGTSRLAPIPLKFTILSLQP